MGFIALVGWLQSFSLVEGKGFAQDEDTAEEQAADSPSSTQSAVVSESSTRSHSPSR